MRKGMAVGLALVCCTLLILREASAGTPTTELQANLVGSTAYPNANGKAKYKQQGTSRELQVEIEDAKPLAGKTLNVVVNGTKVGTLTVSTLGAGSLKLRTQAGQAVPTITKGLQVKVTTNTLTVVVSGTF